MLDRIVAEQWFTARGVAGLWPCTRDGDDVVIADPAAYFASNIHAVSVPFQSRDLSEPVIFTCGAMPKDLSIERMREEVGPKLQAGVRELERIMGQGPFLTRHDI